MRKTTAALLLVSVLALAAISAVSAAPSISIVGDNSSSYPNGQIPRYEKYELSFTIGGVGTAFTDYNPFNPNITQLSSSYWNKKGILVDALLTSPTGKQVTYPCFWYEGSDGWKGWKLRFAPTETGVWTCKIRAKHDSGETTVGAGTFTCVSSSNSGFITSDPQDSRMFRYMDGTPFHAIGMGSEGYDGVSWSTKIKDLFPEMGANGVNTVRVWFSAWVNIEPYAKSGVLNKYDMSAGRLGDSTLDIAKQYGIRLVVMPEDWTHFKSSDNPYIGSGLCGSYTDVMAGTNGAREVYQRKVRYMAARWGYSVNVLGWEMMNEFYGSDSQGARDWHDIMLGTFEGTVRPAFLPSGYNMDLGAQPHLGTSSNGQPFLSNRRGIDWSHQPLSMVNFHRYPAPHQWGYPDLLEDWGYFQSDGNNLDKMGSTLACPWYDGAVDVDRTARVVQLKRKWAKPIVWGEFGLIDNETDWKAAYATDTTGRSVRDYIWPGAFCNTTIMPWKSGWVLGKWGTNPTNKFKLFKSLSNYVTGEDFAGLRQETYYPVSDSLNPSPGIACSNSKIMIMAMHGSNKAYLYAKNLTDVWYRMMNASACPTPASQSGTIQVKGLEPGTYTLERWSTTEIDPATQKVSTATLTVGTDGVASFSVSLGTGLTSGYDCAYKLKKQGSSDSSGGGTVSQPNVTVSVAADRTTAKPGDTVTYTVTYNNTGAGAASNLVITAPVPTNTTYVSGSGGTLSSGSVQWTIPSVAAGATGTVTFKVTVN